jgi:hypothetical protein
MDLLFPGWTAPVFVAGLRRQAPARLGRVYHGWQRGKNLRGEVCPEGVKGLVVAELVLGDPKL